MAASRNEAAVTNLIREFVRPQESLRAIVEAREVVPQRPDASGHRTTSFASSASNRALAVISNEESGVEEGWYTSASQLTVL